MVESARKQAWRAGLPWPLTPGQLEGLVLWWHLGARVTVRQPGEMRQTHGARVEYMLDEIARLSREEQAELLRDLPHVLHDEDAGRKDRILGGPQLAAVQQALELRERIRQRLASIAPASRQHLATSTMIWIPSVKSD